MFNGFNLIRYFSVVFFIFFITKCFSQDYQFFGIIKLNDKIEQAIPYRIVFKENSGKVVGYSITDMTGDHETKTSLEGSYDKQKKWLTIQEKSMIYTKSKISANSFCYINFSGKVDLNSKSSKMQGKFFGNFPNKKRCIDGTLMLSSQGKVEKFLKKAESKINKSKEVDKATKEAVQPTKVFDSIMVNRITKGQNLNVFSAKKEIQINVFDSRMDDGDMVNLYHNELLILKNHPATSKKHTISRNLFDGINVFKIEAVNEGKVSPNTVFIEIVGDQIINLQSTLKTKETSTISVINEN
jgi:hypothetical protein